MDGGRVDGLNAGFAEIGAVYPTVFYCILLYFALFPCRPLGFCMAKRRAGGPCPVRWKSLSVSLVSLPSPSHFIS